MVRVSASDPTDQRLIDNVAKYGWHCTNILEEAGSPPWAFSIGFFHTWQFPELIAVGFRRDTAHAVLNSVAEMLKAGAPLDLNGPSDDLLEGHTCRFIAVPKDNYREYVGFARWFYQGDEFPLYQLVWPSKLGHFPWDTQATSDFKKWQPLLGPAPYVA